MTDSSKTERRETLTDMWSKTARAILRALDSEEPSAASLEVARKFMADNNTTMDAIRDWHRSPLGSFTGRLPKFDDTDDVTEPTRETDPLRVVPPFAPTDSNT